MSFYGLRNLLSCDEKESLKVNTPARRRCRAINISFADTKGNITHTYEGKHFDVASGLLDFGGRWYDPLVGRFITPDNIQDMDLLILTDGLNRYAFENSDPINHTNPTGHWSWSSILGVIIGAALVIGAIALTVATGGTGGVLVAAAIGALSTGGVAGVTYSIEHHDEENAGKFWGGFGTTVALNAAIGAASGALGAWASSAKALSATGRIASKIGLFAVNAMIDGATSVLQTAVDRGVSNMFYGTNDDIFEGWASNFAQAAFMSVLSGAAKEVKGAKSANKLKGVGKPEGSFKLTTRIVLGSKPTNPWAGPGIIKEIMKESWNISKPLVEYGEDKIGMDDELNGFLKGFTNILDSYYL